jgi:Na+/melibiose symporter-like transporter
MPLELQSRPLNGHPPAAGADGIAAQALDRAAIGSVALARAMRDAAARATAAVGVGAIAVIHAVDSVGKWSETRYLFWLSMALIAACVVTGAAVLFHRSRAALLAAAGLAAGVIAAFVLDRTVGLPNATGDIGNWLEPLGLASLVVEGLVVAVGLGGFLSARR